MKVGFYIFNVMKNATSSRRIGLLMLFALSYNHVRAAAAPPIGYSTMQVVEQGDSDAVMFKENLFYE